MICFEVTAIFLPSQPWSNKQFACLLKERFWISNSSYLTAHANALPEFKFTPEKKSKKKKIEIVTI